MTVTERHFNVAAFAKHDASLLRRFAVGRRLNSQHHQSHSLFAQYFNEVQLFSDRDIQTQPANLRTDRLRTQHMPINGDAKLSRMMLEQLCCPATTLQQERRTNLFASPLGFRVGLMTVIASSSVTRSTWPATPIIIRSQSISRMSFGQQGQSEFSVDAIEAGRATDNMSERGVVSVNNETFHIQHVERSTVETVPFAGTEDCPA